MWVTAWIGGSMATVTYDKDVTALLVIDPIERSRQL
jgi:hypothetical protein